MTVLPDIKMANAMTRTVIVGAQKMVDPPLLAPSDGFLNPIRTTPGGINYYDALAQRVPEYAVEGDHPDRRRQRS